MKLEGTQQPLNTSFKIVTDQTDDWAGYILVYCVKGLVQYHILLTFLLLENLDLFQLSIHVHDKPALGAKY